MTSFDPASLASELLWLVIATAFTLPMVLLPGIQQLRGKEVATPWMLVGAWVAAVLPTALGALLLWGWSTKDAEGLRLAATSFAALRLGAWLTTMPLLLLSSGVAVFFALREPDKHWRRSAVVGAGGAAVVALVFGLGLYTDDLVFSGMRAVAYAGLLVPVAVGAAGPRPVLATSLWPLAVAVGEASHRGMVGLVIVLQTPIVTAAMWPEGVRQFYEAVAVHQVVGFAAVALASGVAVMGAWWGRERRAAVAAAALSVATSALIVARADLGPQRTEALAVLCPEGLEGADATE